MQAVILAAGMGRRLGKLTENSTKCMVSLNGRRLIEHTLDALAGVGVSRVVLVVGHGADELRAFVGTAWRGVLVTHVENADYARTNNVYSLLLAGEELAGDDTLVLESDVAFDPELLVRCLADPAPNVAVVARFEPWMDGTVTVLDDARSIVRFVSRDEFRWDESAHYFKTVNIYKLSRAFLTGRFLPFLETYVRTHGVGSYYEQVLRLLAFIGAGDITALPVDDLRWYEIDDVHDLDVASTLFAEPPARLELLERRYGGYWRFPALRDFCYLVNPYFPTPAMVEEMRHSFDTLLRAYPSGGRVQRLLGARLLGCDPASVLVGNGASELIAALLAELGPDERVGTAVPTFDEYRRLVPRDRLAELESRAPDLTFAVDHLVAFAERERIGTLVLVNPANPTGQFLPADALVDLIGRLDAAGVRVILDESFVDFVDGTPGHTLARDETLARFRRLVVVKSISKSYGVPGLRLGLLASGDAELLERVAARVPIWNVNSFAEQFMQLIGKYEGGYWAACRRLAEERARFVARLAELPHVRPLPSGANYVLCELLGGWCAREVAERLLAERWILVKACGRKRGLERGEYVRVAVRDAADNDALVAALAELALTSPAE